MERDKEDHHMTKTLIWNMEHYICGSTENVSWLTQKWTRRIEIQNAECTLMSLRIYHNTNIDSHVFPYHQYGYLPDQKTTALVMFLASFTCEIMKLLCAVEPCWASTHKWPFVVLWEKSAYLGSATIAAPARRRLRPSQMFPDPKCSQSSLANQWNAIISRSAYMFAKMCYLWYSVCTLISYL